MVNPDDGQLNFALLAFNVVNLDFINRGETGSICLNVYNGTNQFFYQIMVTFGYREL
jgi:hypothetical protein